MGQQEDERSSRRSDKAYTKWREGIATGVVHTEAYIDAIQEERPTVTEIRIKCDPDDEEGVLIILKGYLGSDSYVAFHRDETYSAALTAVGNRLRNGSLKWRIDHGWKPTGK